MKKRGGYWVSWTKQVGTERIDRKKLDVIISVRAKDGGFPSPDSILHPCSRCRELCWTSPKTQQAIKEFPAAPFLCLQCAENFAASLKPN